MDTKAVAEYLGTEARILRRFLRDKKSTFRAVGSGSRYTFVEADLPELQRRFRTWLGDKPTAPRTATRSKPTDPVADQRAKDMAVWAEEEAQSGCPLIPDIRDVRVRRAVQRTAREQEQRLMERLMAVGLHVSQMGART
jgi:hypothetical protein